MTSRSIGEFDERGYVNGFSHRGYSPAKCLLELVANTLDSMDMMPSSKTNTLLFSVQRESIKMIDTGRGMDEKGAENMFALHRENHAGDSSRGVSGIGAKPSLYILSGKTDVSLFTRRPDGAFLHILVPWSMIHTTGRYTGMVQCMEMTEDEKAEFIAERSVPHGTTIKFRYSDFLRDVISRNFVKEECNPLDRIGIVFGREKIQFLYKHYEKEETHTLDMYNYFAAEENEYYKGVSEVKIEQHSGEEGDRFLWRKESQVLEIIPFGKGFTTDPKEATRNLRGFQHVGDYTVKVGLRVDPDIFNSENPMLLTATDKTNSYNTLHLGEDKKNYLALNKLVRNNMVIGTFNFPEVNISNARANGEAMLGIKLVQCEVSFNPISMQNNPQDRVMGIQENKNQFDGESLPKNFTRMVKAIKKQKADEIWKYFNEVIAAKRKPEPPFVPLVVPVFQLAPVETPVSSGVHVVAPVAVPVVASVAAAEVQQTALPILVNKPQKAVKGADLLELMESIMKKIKKEKSYKDEYVELYDALKDC